MQFMQFMSHMQFMFFWEFLHIYRPCLLNKHFLHKSHKKTLNPGIPPAVYPGQGLFMMFMS
jgi:hypothetical protein